MARYHIIENNIITNTVEADSADVISGVTLILATVGTIGDLWNSGSPTKPPKWTSLAAGKDAVIAASDTKARSLRDQITANISAAEMASWSIKRTEAIAYQAKGVGATDADAPLLAVEATVRGISTAALVTKVLAKTTTLSSIEAAIAGRNGAINDAAAAALTLDALELIDVEAGWPV